MTWTQERRLKMAEKAKKQWADPENRRRFIEAQKKLGYRAYGTEIWKRRITY